MIRNASSDDRATASVEENVEASRRSKRDRALMMMFASRRHRRTIDITPQIQRLIESARERISRSRPRTILTSPMTKMRITMERNGEALKM